MSPAVTKCFIVAAICIILLYNIAAFYFGGRESTISFVIADWSSANPIVPVAAGILIGHWFWAI